MNPTEREIDYTEEDGNENKGLGSINKRETGDAE
jgi:hypothetical protein